MVTRTLLGQPPAAFKKTMYLSEKPVFEDYDEYGEPIVEYSPPMKLSGLRGVNYQPISAKTDIEMYGSSSKGVHKALVTTRDANYKLFGEWSVGDLVYLNGASPTTKPIWDKSNAVKEPTNGAWANYEINAVREYHMSKHIYFVKHKTTGVV